MSLDFVKGNSTCVNHSTMSLDSFSVGHTWSVNLSSVSHQLFGPFLVLVKKVSIDFLLEGLPLSNLKNCSESRPIAAPWPYLHH